MSQYGDDFQKLLAQTKFVFGSFEEDEQEEQPAVAPILFGDIPTEIPSPLLASQLSPKSFEPEAQPQTVLIPIDTPSTPLENIEPAATASTSTEEAANHAAEITQPDEPAQQPLVAPEETKPAPSNNEQTVPSEIAVIPEEPTVPAPAPSPPTPQPSVAETKPSAPKPIAPPKGGSWASLLRPSATAQSASASAPQQKQQEPVHAPVPAAAVPQTSPQSPSRPDAQSQAVVDKEIERKLLVALQGKPSSRVLHIVPRGLVNTSNTCYMNAVLQAAVNCPPFYNFLTAMGKQKLPESAPILNTLVRLGREFREGTRVDWDFFRPDSPVSIGYLFDAVRKSRRSALLKGRQEDAQEFFTLLLELAHEELLRTEADLKGPESEKSKAAKTEATDGAEEEWEEVGRHNKTSVVTKHDAGESAVARIFGGRLRSVVKRRGAKPSATLEPFFALHLDISPEEVLSIEDALQLLVSREHLEGVTCAKTQTEVEAYKQLTIESLPKVLVLHLKRFAFAETGPYKIQKHIKFTPELNIDPSLLTSLSVSPSPDSRKYMLFGVVSHHGAEAAGGHYTSMVHHMASNQWLAFDDDKVTKTALPEVLRESAYLLFYIQTSGLVFPSPAEEPARRKDSRGKPQGSQQPQQKGQKQQAPKKR